MCHLFVLQRPVEETQKRRQTEPVHVINPGQIHDHKIHLTGRLSQRQVSVPLLETERDRCYAGAIWCLFTPHVTHSFSSSPGRAMSVIGETRSVIGGSGHCWLSSGSETWSTPCSPEYSLELWPESTHIHQDADVIIQTQHAFPSLEVLCQTKAFWEFWFSATDGILALLRERWQCILGFSTSNSDSSSWASWIFFSSSCCKSLVFWLSSSGFSCWMVNASS